MFRTLLIGIVAVAAVSIPAAATGSPNVTLDRRRRPGFNISSKNADGHGRGHLDPGTYDVTVTDNSIEHNFHLSGPGVDQRTYVEVMGTVNLDGDDHGRDLHVHLRRPSDADEGQLHGRERSASAAASTACGEAERQGDDEDDHAQDGLRLDGPDADREQVQAHGLGYVEDPELPPEGAGREQEDRRRREGEGDLDARRSSRARHVPLGQEPQAARHVHGQGRRARSRRGGGRARCSARRRTARPRAEFSHSSRTMPLASEPYVLGDGQLERTCTGEQAGAGRATSGSRPWNPG